MYNKPIYKQPVLVRGKEECHKVEGTKTVLYRWESLDETHVFSCMAANVEAARRKMFYHFQAKGISPRTVRADGESVATMHLS